MPPSSRGPLFVWAVLPDQPDLAGVYTALAGIGCDNISFVSDLARIPLSLPREDSPCEEKDSPTKDCLTPSLRPASSHTTSDSSCSRSITPPTSALPPRDASTPAKSEPCEEADDRDASCGELSAGSPPAEADSDGDEHQEYSDGKINGINLHAIVSLLGTQSMMHVQQHMVHEETPQNEPGSSVDLSFLRNVPHSEGKEKNVTCQICEKSFSRNARNVSRHAATHFPRAAARYTCGKCGEAFGRNDRAKYHVDTKHAGKADLHDKAKDSEYSEEWVQAVKKCFPGFDFSPRDTHARSTDSLELPVSPASISGMLTANGRNKVQCKLCSWMLFPCSPTAFAIEHAVSHCPPQFTCSECGEQADRRPEMDAHNTQKHGGSATVIDASAQGEDRLREFAMICFPSRSEDMDRAFEERARAGAKKRRIDSLIESKKKVMKMG